MKKTFILTLILFACSVLYYSCKHQTDIQPATEIPSNLSYSSNVLEITQGNSATSVSPVVNGTGPIQYSITTVPSSNGSISINSVGIINVNNSTPSNTYNVSVIATNAAGTTSFNNVYKIIVDPVAAAPSSLSYSGDTLTVEEGSQTVFSSLPNTNGSNPITYTISSSPSSLLTINNSTGVVQVSSGITVGTYPLTITASNNLGSKTFNNVLIVKIVVAGSPSQLSYSPNTLSLADDVNASSVSPSIVGNATLSYSLTSTPVASSISIDNTTGIISVGNSTAVGVYDLRITASNSIGSTTTTYTVTVIPSFNLDILPLMTNYCTSCHNGVIQHDDFNKYSTVQTFITTILSRTQMPTSNSQFMPQGGTPLSTSEINLIKQWQSTGMKQ